MSAFKKATGATVIMGKLARYFRSKAAESGLMPEQNAHFIPAVASSFAAVSARMVRGRWNTLFLTPPAGTSTQIVQRSTDGVTWTNLDSVPSGFATYSDPDPPSGSVHYRVQEMPSGKISAVITITPPAAPSNLQATFSGGVVSLTWHDNNPSGTTGFIAERSVNFIDWTQVGSVGVVTTATDTPPAGNIFFYRVRSETASGVSAPSAWALAGPGIYGWLRASSITGVADGASIGTTWTDGVAGHITLTKTGSSIWKYKAAGIGGLPEILTDTTGWHQNGSLAQPFSIVWVGENLGPNVTDTQPRQWLIADNYPAAGIEILDAQNPYNGFVIRDAVTGGVFEPSTQCDSENIWLSVVNGASSSLTQQGVSALASGGGLSSGAVFSPGKIRAAVGLSELLVLSCALSASEASGINAAFSQLYQIPMPPGKAAPAPTPAFDTIITPIVQTQAYTAYDLGPDGNIWYVTTTGLAANDGKTLATAWPLLNTLFPTAGSVQANSIKPGDVIEINGGTYRDPNAGPETLGFKISLQGQPGQYIKIRPVPGQRVIIDGGLQAVAPAKYVAVEYLEGIVSDAQQDTQITFNTNPLFTWPQGGFNDNAGVQFVWHNNVLHDGTEQSDYFDSVEPHIADNIYYDAGQLTFGPRPECHANYAHNLNGFGPKIWSGNVFGPNREFSLQFFTETGQLQKMYIDGGCFFDLGETANQSSSSIIQSVNSAGPITDVRFNNAAMYNAKMTFGLIGENDVSATVDGNYLGGTSLIQALSSSWSGGFSRSDAANYSGLNCTATLRVHMYDADIATLCLYGDGSLSPLVRLNGFLNVGDTYAIVDVLNIWGPRLASGTFDGSPVIINLPSGHEAFQCCWIYRTAPAAPAAPVDLEVTTTSQTSLTLTWNAPDQGWTSFTVKRATSLNGTYSTVGTASGTSYVDTVVNSQVVYYYKVEAVNGYGTSADSTTASNA